MSTGRRTTASHRRIPGVRTASVQDYFKSGCEQQPSPSARETRPPRGHVFRFLRSDFEGWSRAVGAAVSRGLHHGVAELPPPADRMGRKSPIDFNLGSPAGQGAGFRLGRSRWSGHYSLLDAWGSAPLVRSRPVANGDPRVMTWLTRRGYCASLMRVTPPPPSTIALLGLLLLPAGCVTSREVNVLVTDGRTSTPIEGASIRVERAGVFFKLGAQSVPMFQEGKTGQDGRWRGRLADGAGLIHVTAPDHAEFAIGFGLDWKWPEDIQVILPGCAPAVQP